uniref:Major facilitator superfamily (MFS) profile domain-containing protein n=1 Tax=Rhodococcus sp. NS1 TaxID=402236 RepID=A0A097SQT9_9NOCA|nr:hypothetical protein LRS1606.441 [Rhodococcus sp. NS1]
MPTSEGNISSTATPPATSRIEPVRTSGITNAGESRRTAWGLTGLLMLLYTINNGDKIVLGLVAQPLKNEFGFTSAQIGLAGSLFFLAMTVSGFFTNVFNRWVSLRTGLAFLAIAWAFCMLPMVVFGSLVVLIVSRVLLGFFEGPSSALIHTATYSWHPNNKRALPGAIITSAAALAKIALGPALGYLIVAHGWRSAFIVMSISSVVWCAIWLTTWRPGPYGAEKASKASSSTPSELPNPESRIRWIEIFKLPTFLAGAFAVFSFYALTTIVMTWLPSYFEEGLGFSAIAASSLFAVPSICALASLLASTLIADRLAVRGVNSRIHRGLIPGIALLLCGIGMVSLPMINNSVLVVVVVSVSYGLGTVVYPLFNAAISQIAPQLKLAGTLGVFLGIQTCGGLIAPYVAGLIVDSHPGAVGYAMAFQIFGAVAVLGAIGAIAFVNPHRDSRVIRTA